MEPFPLHVSVISRLSACVKLWQFVVRLFYSSSALLFRLLFLSVVLLCVFTVNFYCEVSPNQIPLMGQLKLELHLELQYFIHRTFFWETLMGNRTQENATILQV